MRNENPSENQAYELARKMARSFDKKLSDAISAHLGRSDWELEEIEGRVVLQTIEGKKEMARFVLLDGVPIFAYEPVKLTFTQEGDRTICKATQNYKDLSQSES